MSKQAVVSKLNILSTLLDIFGNFLCRALGGANALPSCTKKLLPPERGSDGRRYLFRCHRIWTTT